MAKKYILRSFKPGTKSHNKVNNTLVNLSTLGLNKQQSILKNSISMGASETTRYNSYSTNTLMPYEEDFENEAFQKYKDITKNGTSSYAYYDLSYPQRVEYLRYFSQHQTISFVLDTIADETIVFDKNNYFAYLDTDKLKSNLSAGNEIGEKLIETCDRAFHDVYLAFGWDKSNGAWDIFKKFLIDGYLSFEIIYNDPDNPTKIIGFKYIDPVTLEPSIQIDSQGREIKVWYQSRGDSNERIIPDTHLIYINWSDGIAGEQNRISYLEGLTRSFNMLSQIENSRLIWNIQNAQKRMKIIVPVGDMPPYKADALMNQLKADWNEETHIDLSSGEMVVNGLPQFSFTKTYFFPQRNSGSVTIEELAPEGYDLNSIEPVKYFWRRFILDTKLPANRFLIDPTGDGGHQIIADDSAITREEWAFSRFINRIRSIYREILLKPLWIQICLYIPKLSKSEYLRQALGIVFNEENAFVQAKERLSLQAGVNVINSLYGLQDSQGKPYFSIKFLIQKFLDLSDDDFLLNEKYKQEEILDILNKAKAAKDHAAINAATGGGAPGGMPGAGDDFGGDFGGGGGDFGGGFDGGGDFGGGGGDFGGAGDDFGAPPAPPAGGGDDF